MSETQKRYQARNPEKIRAHRILRREVDSGRIKRPEKCSECGCIGRIQAHHPDHLKPLDVEWLCAKCHARKDARRSGAKHYKARFTEEDVAKIRRLHSEGLGARRIGKLFGCDPTTVARVFRRETWAHLP